MRNLIKKAISDFRRRNHRGSVLILVVVLTVLLALMGTALLSTTRSDRYVAAQNSANTEIDMLVEGVKQIAIATITDPANRFDAQNWHWDMPYTLDGIPTTASAQHDIWLSPRLPIGTDNGAQFGVVVWPTIGILPAALPNTPHFDVPGVRPDDPNAIGTYSIRDTVVPHIRPGFSEDNKGPTWQFTPPNSPKFAAADADGDGIPDSGFFKLPFGELDGVTYYAALRIVDNNSAVNINTAGSSQSDFDFSPASNQVGALGDTWSATSTNLGMFRSHVGLKEMLYDYDSNWANNLKNKEFVALSTRRYNSVAPPPTAAYDDSGTQISGVTFITQGDLLDHQGADRLANPGHLSGTQSLQAFSSADEQALIHRFTLAGLYGSKSDLESTVEVSMGSLSLDSLYDSAMNLGKVTPVSSVKGRKAYLPGNYKQWFDENFNYAGVTGNGMSRGTASLTFTRPIRSLLTTYNPVSNQVVEKVPSGGLPIEMAPYRDGINAPKGTPVKANINTASFGELYRAFWSVMSDNLPTTGTPFPLLYDPTTDPDGLYKGMKFLLTDYKTPDYNAPVHPQRMFRSSIRDPRPTGMQYFDSREQLKLRAAAAATQAIYMRDHTKVMQSVNLTAQGVGPVTVNLFPAGSDPNASQLFIVEVFAWFEKNAAPPPPAQPPPYVAIALYNPFPVNVVLDGNWSIQAKKRTVALWATGAITEVYRFNTTVTVPPDGILIIDNFGGTNPMPNRPASSDLDPTSPPGSLNGSTYQYMSINGLEAVLNNEMILMQAVTPGNPVATSKPVDSFDFTGFDRNTVNGLAWHYERPHGTSDKRWQCVYPGRYDGSLSARRQQGTEQSGPWDRALNTNDEWVVAQTHMLPLSAAKKATYPSLFSIQLNNQDFPGPNAGTGKFPFGGFARNGDILQVPFIASYTIVGSGGLVIELNSVSMDAAFAEDTDVSDDVPNYTLGSFPIPAIDAEGQREQIGRFCPIRAVGPPPTLTPTVDDFDATQSYDPISSVKWHYRWARGIFDYLTVQSPGTDYLPNDWSAIKSGTAKAVKNDSKYPAADQANFNVTDISSQQNVGAEDTVGVQGLININTAPWKVLAAIPWVPKGQLSTWWDPPPAPGLDDNDMIAKRIVNWRDGDPSPSGTAQPHGAFKSIFDLYAITYQGNLPQSVFLFDKLQLDGMGGFPGTEPGPAQGDFSGGVGASGTDGVRNDFEEQYLILNKVSNLLTTRSDTFTVYVLLQGWRGTTKVVERRSAMMVDRTRATKEKPADVYRIDFSND